MEREIHGDTKVRVFVLKMNVMNGNGVIIFVDLCFSNVCILVTDVFLHVWWLVIVSIRICKHRKMSQE